VTKTQGLSADREGAFRLLESRKIESQAIAKAMFEKTALDCEAHDDIFVAIDQTALEFVDRQRVRGLGPCHNRVSKVLRTIHWMNSLVLDKSGAAIGLLDQQSWIRDEEKCPWGKQDPRPHEERESWKWVTAIEAAQAKLKAAAPDCRPWLVRDRGADSHGLWTLVQRENLRVTVRSCYDRQIERNRHKRYLWASLRRQRVAGRFTLRVPGNAHRTARVAEFEVRLLCAKTRVRAGKAGPQVWMNLTAVQARETSRPPAGEERIDWKLLSTEECSTFADAMRVIRSYTLRWRIEEFHKTWKTGACDVENSQLRSLEAIRRWATILAAVATRVERLKILSREQPQLDALKEFTQDELDAVIILSETKKHKRGDALTLEQAVRLVGILGGHMGYPSSGPPGSITLRRGLEQVIPAARALAVARTSG